MLSFKRFFPELKAANQIVLSESGDFDEAARNLFSAMRSLDDTAASIILAEELPEIHLGKAINDRL